MICYGKWADVLIHDSNKRNFGDLEQALVYHKRAITLLRSGFMTGKVLASHEQDIDRQFYLTRLRTKLKTFEHHMFNDITLQLMHGYLINVYMISNELFISLTWDELVLVI